MATATRKTAAKKAASPEAKATEAADTLTAPDTGAVVPKDPNDGAAKAGDEKSDAPTIKESDIQYVQVVDGPTAPEPEKPDVETREVGFLYVHHLDPARKLPGGTYLDDVQRYEAEAARALVEDREPDFENAPAVQGTPLRSVDQIKAELPPHAELEPELVYEIPVVK